MSKFEDNLLSDLLIDHGAELAHAQRPQPRRSVSRPTWVAAGVLAVAAAATAGITVFGDTEPAYAVTKNNDGTVTITITELKAIEPANAKLRELGVRIKAVPQTEDCATLDRSRFYHGSYPTPELNSNDTVTLALGIPEGYTVLLSVQDDPDGRGISSTLPVKDPAPSCLLDSRINPDTGSSAAPDSPSSSGPAPRPSN